MHSPAVNEDIRQARLAIQRAKKKDMRCSEACIELETTEHAADCRNKDRYDVV